MIIPSSRAEDPRRGLNHRCAARKMSVSSLSLSPMLIRPWSAADALTKVLSALLRSPSRRNRQGRTLARVTGAMSPL